MQLEVIAAGAQRNTHEIGRSERVPVDEFSPAAARVVDATRDVTVQMLARHRAQPRVVALVRRAHGFAEALVAEAKRRVAAPPVACKAGCSWCCHVAVTVTIPEVVHLAHYVRGAAVPSSQRSEMIARLNAYVAQMGSLNLSERAVRRNACPFLNRLNGFCSLWKERPLLCRSWTSADAAVCQDAYRQPRQNIAAPVLRVQRDLMQAVGHGLRLGLDELSLESEAVFMSDALVMVLAEPDIVGRWLSGERVFGPAAVGEHAVSRVVAASCGDAEAGVSAKAKLLS